MSVRAKGLLIILDGLGDRPCAALDGRTPLEAAVTPTLDHFATLGSCGLVDPLAPGVPVGTQIGAGVLMGLHPGELGHLARGPIEAAGVGLTLRPGDIALRCNLATVERGPEGLALLDRRAGRIREGIEELAAALDGVDLGGGIRASFRPATQHRAVLRLSGSGLSPDVTDTEPRPFVRGGPAPLCSAIRRGQEDAERSARAINAFVEFAHRTLDEHPVNAARRARGELVANFILTRGAGSAQSFQALVRKLGLRAAVVSGERTVLGLGVLLGFEACSDPDFTALPGTDLRGKLRAAMNALEECDLAVVHVKTPDICSHERDPDAKRAVIEAFDAALAEFDLDGLVVGVTSDHSSDSTTGLHTGDPVPSLLQAPFARRDAVEVFGESTCASGGLGRITGSAFLRVMLDTMGAIPNLRPADRSWFGLA